MLLTYYLPAAILVIAIMVLSVVRQKLTLAGAITGGVIAASIFIGAGYTGIAMLGAFFILGTVATSWKKEEKLKHKPVSDHSGKRKAGQVLANGGVAAITGMLAYFLPNKVEVFRLMMAASLASAMADTLSSELGMVYGRRFYNMITWQKDEKGLDGVISLEGTLIGVAGSVITGIIYAAGFGWNITLLYIILAGTIGNLSDSVLGALFERKQFIGNDMVNFLNTFIAALAMWLLITIF
jgi:uncharacterized protein (TIGR00297 family)